MSVRAGEGFSIRKIPGLSPQFGGIVYPDPPLGISRDCSCPANRLGKMLQRFSRDSRVFG